MVKIRSGWAEKKQTQTICSAYFILYSGQREDDYEEKPPEEKVQEQKAQKKHKPAKPSFSTRTDMHRDIKNIMRKEDSDEHGSKDYLNYKKKLDSDADRTYSRENRKAKKRRKKEAKKNKTQS